MQHSPYKVLSECARIIGPPAPGTIKRGRPWHENAVRILTFCALRNLTQNIPDYALAEMVGLKKTHVCADRMFERQFVSPRGAEAFVKWVRWNLENPHDRIENVRVRMLATASRRVKNYDSLPKVLANEA